MPFIEVIDCVSDEEKREVATRSMTEALCGAYEIKPEIVTCYYFCLPDYSYGHAGKHGKNAEKFRVFVKVHAFPRPQVLKQKAATALTEALVAAYGAAPKDVIVYFIDRDPSDAFHGGTASA
ncbi:hypothetical protein C8J27_103239 [Rhodobacter aestuarii]|uniref:Phenylpyruvate tautomerase PptA, 4-oxalocrotonate tautomerase family n=1 Tax=Rhodobacter aestuarii TaxID=453582 RepID=A0A1N7K0I8_9RHOB|nr:hypothetical protein [Rhodobacter aestuarii]PTV95909.1 hypothetical protein C8J27_103239 [Rhodobacter aestuarii]SIS55113.1 hypothetical protein SAMN05421580_102195 [Rhodobacter aestuarii]